MTGSRKAYQIFAFCLALCLASSCTPIRDNENVTDGAGDDPVVRQLALKLTLVRDSSAADISSNSIECDKIGGNYGRHGLAGSYICVLSYSDAGKICAKKPDCVARCMAPLGENSQGMSPGKCEANTSPFGCFATIDENGKVGPALCVD